MRMSAKHPPHEISPALVNEAPFMAELLRGRELYYGFNAIDLREMGKFTETPNTLGLPLHPIANPPNAPAREFEGRMEDLPAAEPQTDPAADSRTEPAAVVAAVPSGLQALREAMAPGAAIIVRGELGAGLSRPFRVLGLFPQTHAHLAHGFHELITPDETPRAEADKTAHGNRPPADLYLIHWPSFPDAATLLVSGSRAALVLGTDDLRAAAPLIIESANRFWTERNVDLENRRQELRAEGGRPADLPEDIRLLPGGGFVTGAGDLIFAGEALPENWAEKLIAAVDALQLRSATEIALAGAEPWIAEGGGLAAPFWRNPPLPAFPASLPPGWARAIEHPDALPFGAPVDERGQIRFDAADESAFVIAPRAVLPAPFANAAGPIRVRRLFTHHYVRQDAMELWARGFPFPQMI